MTIAKPEWLWLNKAMEFVAYRLAAAAPDRFSDPDAAIVEARAEILEQAAIGALKIEGMLGDPESQSQPERDWEIVHPSYWDECHRLDEKEDSLDDFPEKEGDDEDEDESGDVCPEPSRSVGPPRKVFDPIVSIDWEVNAITIEIEGVVTRGFHSLKIKADEIDRLWPSSAVTADGGQITRFIGLSTMIDVKNKGGRPPKYQPDLWLEIIRIAEFDSLYTDDGLPDRPGVAKRLEEFCVSRWGPDGAPKSSTTVDDLLRLVYDKLPQKL